MAVTEFVYSVFIDLILLYEYTSALDYSRHNLTAVPSPPVGSGLVHDLDLAHNYIQVLNDTSFTGYEDLIRLYLLNINLQYIMDGTFIKMQQLETLKLQMNAIIQLPSVFGPSDQTLKYCSLWAGIVDSSIFVYPYFAAFSNLTYLNLGGRYNMQSMDASILPPMLTTLILNKAMMNDFPNLSAYSPRMRTMSVQDNRIHMIP